MPSADQPGIIRRAAAPAALALSRTAWRPHAICDAVGLRPASPIRATVLLWALALGPVTVWAQDVRAPVAQDSSGHWMLGAMVMVPTRSGYDLSGVGLTAAAANPRRFGPDLMLAVVPRDFESGLVAFAARANLALPIAVGRGALFIPSAGGTLIWADPPLRLADRLGYNAMVAMVLFNHPFDNTHTSTGLRAAIGIHRFGASGSRSLPILEFGLVRRSR